MYCNSSDVPTNRINRIINKCGSRVLSLAIAFVERTAHENLHVLVRLFLNGSTASNH